MRLLLPPGPSARLSNLLFSRTYNARVLLSTSIIRSSNARYYSVKNKPISKNNTKEEQITNNTKQNKTTSTTKINAGNDNKANKQPASEDPSIEANNNDNNSNIKERGKRKPKVADSNAEGGEAVGKPSRPRGGPGAKDDEAQGGEKPEKTRKTPKLKAEKADKTGKPDKTEKADKTERANKAEKAEKAEKADKTEKAEKTPKPPKPPKPDVPSSAAIKKRMATLQTDIEKYNHAYYNMSQSLISDHDYDVLFAELEKLEKENPKFASSISPTKKVGAAVVKEVHKFMRPMLSLTNTYNKSTLGEFFSDSRRALASESSAEPLNYVMEIKYDGNACCLQYKDGQLVKAITRGDGTQGEDITKNVLVYAKNFPETVPILRDGKLISEFEIRGELIISKKTFANINTARAAVGEKLFKNARNLVSGMLHVDLSDYNVSGEGQITNNASGEAPHDPAGQERHSTEGQEEAEHVGEDNVEETNVEQGDSYAEEASAGSEEVGDHESAGSEGEVEGEMGEDVEGVKHEEEPKLEANSINNMKGSMDFMAYTLVLPSGTPPTTHFQHLAEMRSFGFTTDPMAKLCETPTEVEEFIDQWETNRHNYEWELDGCVVKVNSMKLQTALSEHSRAPRWAIAYKYKPLQVRTKLLGVTLQVGRTGRVVPVAELTPVEVSGSTVSRATLNNFSYMIEQNMKLGDEVIVEKGGEVIPKVSSIEFHNREEQGKDDVEPEVDEMEVDAETGIEKLRIEGLRIGELCPKYLIDGLLHCPCKLKHPLVRSARDYLCNNLDCPPQKVTKLTYFCSRQNMYIAGVGPAVAQQLIHEGLVHDVADLYYLKLRRDDMLKLERWEKQKVDTLLQQIEYSKSRGLEHALAGLGIAHIGKETAKRLVKHFKNVDNLLNNTHEVNGIPIGKTIASSLVEALKPDVTENNGKSDAGEPSTRPRTTFRGLLLKLKAAGVKLSSKNVVDVKTQALRPSSSPTSPAPTPVPQEKIDTKITGKKLVFTGSFSASRLDLEKEVERCGGTVAGAVSKALDYLVLGVDPGSSKVEKAEKCNVKTISEAELKELMQPL